MLIEGVTVPASRFRALQFIAPLRARGVEITVRHGYGPLYNRMARTSMGTPYKLATSLRRVVGGLDAGRFDVVFVQRPALPFTPLPEQLIAAINPRVVFDFDDNLFINAAGQPEPTRERTFRAIVAASRHVICGNQFLAAQAARPETSTIIPTVLDTDRYTPGRSALASDARVLLGWMGTAANFRSLRLVLPDVLDALARHPDARFRLVSNGSLPELADHPQVEQVAWRADQEVDQLRAFDVGLMPLEDTITSLGKCGFKMIQYMAVGRPVIASAVGANVEIFEGSGAGALVAPGASWADALDAVIEATPAARDAQGQAARAHIVAHYSVSGVLDAHLNILECVAAS